MLLGPMKSRVAHEVSGPGPVVLRIRIESESEIIARAFILYQLDAKCSRLH